MYRYFADPQGHLLAKCSFRTICMATVSELYVDDTRDLNIDQWQLDLKTNNLIEKTTE